MTTCTICKRPLGVASDPFSVDCGGDCLLCMADAEDPTHMAQVREILRGIEKAGANARALGTPYFDNPYLKAEALPAATGEPTASWVRKHGAWAYGWEMEGAVRACGSENPRP